MEYEGDVDINCDWCARKNPQNIVKRTGRRRNQKTCGDYPDYNIIKIGQNTEKWPGDLRSLAVTQTPVRNISKR